MIRAMLRRSGQGPAPHGQTDLASTSTNPTGFRLSKTDKDMIVRLVASGMSVNEVALMYGVNVSTVRNHVKRRGA